MRQHSFRELMIAKVDPVVLPARMVAPYLRTENLAVSCWRPAGKWLLRYQKFANEAVGAAASELDRIRTYAKPGPPWRARDGAGPELPGELRAPRDQFGPRAKPSILVRSARGKLTLLRRVECPLLLARLFLRVPRRRTCRPFACQ